jgi:hypothetical protein
MNRVTLTSDGTLQEAGAPVSDKPLRLLGHGLELSSVSLRSLFRMLEKYPVLTELNDFYPAYLDQYRKSPEDRCRYDEFEALVFGKTVEMIGFPGKPRMEIYNALRGVRAETYTEIRNLSLELLLDMPLTLGRLKHVVFGDRVDVLEFETVYTLFEFIDGILWDLGFQGTLVCEIRR